MKTETVRYVVQYKSVYAPRGDWKDYDDQARSIPEAQTCASGLRQVNENVRVIKRAITETEVA